MKILIVSDSHGYNHNIKKVLKKVGVIDAFIHLGDIIKSPETIHSLLSCPSWFVAGNNDFLSTIPKEDVITLGGYQIYLTHGHRHRVNYDTEVLKDAARLREADIVDRKSVV